MEVSNISAPLHAYNLMISEKHLRSKESFVQLYIYIISGKKVMELSDEAQVAGTHRLEIKGDTFSKGIYFCVLKTNPIRAGQYTKLIKY